MAIVEIIKKFVKDVTPPSKEQNAKIEAALKALEFQINDLVIDVGCGTGFLFDHLTHKIESIVGIDLSLKNLIKSKERAQKYFNVHLILADADNLPLKEKSFNKIFGLTLLQNMPHPESTLNEFFRVAKDDGVIIVTGLKKIFNLKSFKEFLSNAKLDFFILENNENLKCFVAICKKIEF